MKGVYKEKEEGMLRPKWKERYRCSRVVASVSFLLCMLEAADNLGDEDSEGMMRLEESEGKMREGKKEGRNGSRVTKSRREGRSECGAP
jgi:hypothetical protein